MFSFGNAQLLISIYHRSISYWDQVWEVPAFRAAITQSSNRIPITCALDRGINAISPDTEIRRRHIGATSADDPSAAAHSSNCRERIETACPFGWYRKCDNIAPATETAKRWLLKVSRALVPPCIERKLTEERALANVSLIFFKNKCNATA